MFRLFSLFRILIIVSIVLSGCQSAKAVVTELNTTANAAVTANLINSQCAVYGTIWD